jgi:hypothetical protein
MANADINYNTVVTMVSIRNIVKRILDYIKNNPNSDCIDIAIGTSIIIERCLPILHQLENDNIILRVYIGIRTSYIINE